jgi:hypothetical protein
MRKVMRLVVGALLLSSVCIGLVLTTPGIAQAQTAGNKAVYTSGGVCCTSSAAFIDASVLSGSNICEQIYNALQVAVSGHVTAVVDARGVNPTPACGSGETPWLKSGTNVITAATILLPAGTITISSPWIIPDGTRLIGTGVGQEVSQNNTAGTTLQVPSGFTGTMLQMGDNGMHCPGANNICHAISVEDLTLDGEGQSNVNGILNSNSQELSYVNHVKFFQIIGTGLSVSGNAQNSGPYTNLTFDTGSITPSSSTTCAQIEGLNGTRGIHGLTCISSTNGPTAAVYLDSSNNSIEDVRVLGFYDGILVGSQAAAHSNVLFNIYGDTTTRGLMPPVHVVHISKNKTVTDLTIMAVNNPLGNPIEGEYSIEDDETSTFIGDPYVALYGLGEPSGGAYSRFTTSPNAATWAVGSTNLPTTGCTTTNLGSVYSATATGSGSVWVCENSSNPAWALVK